MDDPLSDGIDVAWAFRLPPGATEVRVPAPPGLLRMAHIRGELRSEVPCFGVATLRRRPRGQTLAEFRRTFSESLDDVTVTPLRVVGARWATRLDGLVDMGEGLAGIGPDRIALVVAGTRRAWATLALRTRPADDAAHDVDAVLGSFHLERTEAPPPPHPGPHER